ncbi:Cobalt uptake protein cot1 [Pyricularia grisea]|nr:Cobalt uptake protein cot1 [Pyricularia grisea]
METLSFEPAVERQPSLYSARVEQSQTRCRQLAAEFFKDGVKRARERHTRQELLNKKLDLAANSPSYSKSQSQQLWSNAGKLEAQYLRFLRTPNRPDDYDTIKLIGRGAFGESQTIAQLQAARVRAERDILAESDSPWVVKLYTTFQDSNFLYMLMEFLPGGDLMTMLIKYQVFSEDITRFYMAEVIEAIEAVHRLGFIHRDIKPDNILLDRHGHIKLTDFGLSTGFRKLHDTNYYQRLLKAPELPKPSEHRHRDSVNIDQINMTVSNRDQINEWRRSRRTMAFSAVGTPDYIAPELVMGLGYSFSIDWWSLGAIMYECLIGWAPFCSEDATDAYRKIVNWRDFLYFPEDFQLSYNAENLIRSLMCEAENRLGRIGAEEIKAHPFFTGVDFTSLRRIRAPFEPHLSSETDTAYFPSEEELANNAVQLEAARAAAEPAGTTDGFEPPEMTLPFIGYTFKRFENNFQ